MVAFCPECGSLMHARGGEMVCSSCGATEPRDEDRAAEFVSTEEQTDDDLVESTPDAGFEGKPTTDDVVCGRCGHGRAWYTIKQTASADEPPTRFFKCRECGHRWREYG